RRRGALTAHAAHAAAHHVRHLAGHREAHADACTLEASAGTAALLHALGGTHHHLGLGELLIASHAAGRADVGHALDELVEALLVGLVHRDREVAEADDLDAVGLDVL